MSDVVRGTPTPSSTVTQVAEGITLKKDAIGLPEVLFQSITAMAPAAAVATALSPAIPLAGASLPLAVALATVVCALIASCIGQLAIHIPSAGGMYTYISRSLGARWGFLSAWTFLLAQPLLLPLVALVWGQYAEDIFHTLTGIDIAWYFWAILGNIILFALTYRGIKLSADVSVILGAIEIAIIVALSLTMIFTSGHNDLATFTPVYSAQNGWVGIFQGMIFVFLAFVGFETAAPLGEETAHPKRNIPRAVIYSAIGIGIYYVFASYAGVNGWGIPKIQDYAASAAPWADLGRRYWGAVGPVIISFAILNSAIGNGNAGINATSRVAYAMGRIGTLPSVFARLSKYQTPVVGILVHTVMSIVVSVGCALLLGGPQNAFNLIGAVLTLGLLLLYFASCVSVFVFYRRERPQDFRILQHVIVPVIPLIVLCAVIYFQVWPILPYPLNLTVPIVVVWILLGGGYMLYLNRSNPLALERGKEVFLKDLEPEPKGLVEGLL
jgi:amino acid transporter